MEIPKKFVFWDLHFHSALFTVRQYLHALSDSRGLCRTLGEIEPCRDPEGNLQYSVGNSAVVFRIRHAGKIRSLRCYLRPMRHLREIYGPQLLEKELYLHHSPSAGEWVDVVLGEWIEGEELQQSITQAVTARDSLQLESLSRHFDALGKRLLADTRAHGDLKPENIIVDTSEELVLIDFDACYLPSFTGERSPELGTAAYQHPQRSADDFNRHLDDYPIALISTALHALALDPTLGERFAATDGLLYSPQAIPADPAYQESLALFEQKGEAVAYRIARLLTSPSLQLFNLERLLEEALRRPPVAPPATATPPELFVKNGLWGYRTPHGCTIAPLYDCGFEFSEGLAAVLLGSCWHYIDSAGKVRLSCPGCSAVKPFRNGLAQVIRNGVKETVSHPLRQRPEC